MAVNLRRDAWSNEQQYDAVYQMALEIDRLRKEMEQRFGTWAPALSFGGSAAGITYSLQSGFWMKQGRLVIASGALTLTNNGTGVGSALITNLPFNVKDIITSSSVDGFGQWTWNNNIGAAQDSFFIYPIGGTVTAAIEKILAAGTTVSAATDVDIPNTFAGRFTLAFYTDDP